MRPIGRCGAQRPLNDRRDLIVIDRTQPAEAGFVEQPVDTLSQKAAALLADRVLVNAMLDQAASKFQRPRRWIITTQ